MKRVLLFCTLITVASICKSQSVMTAVGDGYAEFTLTDTKYLYFDDVKYENPDPLGKNSEYHAKVLFGKGKFEITYFTQSSSIPIGGYIPLLKEHQVFSLTESDGNAEYYSLERKFGSVTEKFTVIFIPAAKFVTVLYLESTNDGKTWNYKYWGSGKY